MVKVQFIQVDYTNDYLLLLQLLNINLMMKKLLILGLFLSAFVLNAQGIGSYKYIAIADELPDFKKDNYNLDSFMQHLLEKKGYTIVRGNEEDWPQELKNNSCSILRANPVPGKYFLKIKITVDFVDCNGKVVASYSAHSAIENYKKAYQDAMKKAFVQLPNSIGKETLDLNQLDHNKNIVEEIEDNTKGAPKVYQEIPISEPIQNQDVFFHNNSMKVKFLVTTDNTILLIDQDTSSVYAEMTPTSRNGVYRVSLNQNGKKIDTIGFYDGNSIEIETETANIILQKVK